MSIVTFGTFFLILFITEILYFKIASRFNIIDQPNHRSSHAVLVLRGGGIIFVIAPLLYSFYFGFEYFYFLLGLIAIAFISFLDDIKPVSNKLRLSVHLISVILLFYQMGILNLPFYWIVLAIILVIGIINAVNFMDGINGITGAYALITLCSLLYINIFQIVFIKSNFLIISILSLLVFNIFNFRIKAKCFAGDVGSVSIAFIIMYLVGALILKTLDFTYFLILLLYGLDTVSTIFFRLMRKENIFDAHRSHFYQYLANERKVPHLIVSSSYALVQLLINAVIIYFLPKSIPAILVVLVFSTIIFIIVRFSTEGSRKLFGTKIA
ncbi:UDP-GlcNAc--UDP-phosphate GlcNAc-1-phosphate transferase [Pedobacter sp. MR2016-24]|uniref:UDP-GlcNAc--UDP-phosphate GlcNAc-1-phosphate transferase n=1 Tax=Pedobacter sp. MR2016-24 TaxID=2994466 RepID=UPI002246F1B9|nr:UDP-GlcNAc--UDP-phosphate GlcNAc-1-phosphate transferase [Pedobacter sp. MR2016-24]MCX2485269.1 UDP-GlcNAc--UDP-phosphate GlcNAc-1-phosphate transferase [Pedobacter sp. MR2016-24]